MKLTIRYTANLDENDVRQQAVKVYKQKSVKSSPLNSILNPSTNSTEVGLAQLK